MRRHTSPTTPFGRKVQVAPIEAGLRDRVTIETVGGTPLDPGNIPVGRNPLGKIPAPLRPEAARIAPRVAGQRARIARALDAPEGRWTRWTWGKSRWAIPIFVMPRASGGRDWQARLAGGAAEFATRPALRAAQPPPAGLGRTRPWHAQDWPQAGKKSAGMARKARQIGDDASTCAPMPAGRGGPEGLITPGKGVGNRGPMDV